MTNPAEGWRGGPMPPAKFGKIASGGVSLSFRTNRFVL